MKQSMLFSNNSPQQTTYDNQPPSYQAISLQDDIYAQFNSVMQSQHSQQSTPQPTSHPTPQKSKRHRSARQPQEEIRTDANSGTMSLPDGFSTVSIDRGDLNSIQSINTNASYRNLSENMYEDTNTSISEYKNTLVSNMVNDVMATANYLRQVSGNDSRSYLDQVNSGPIDTSYGAHQMNILAAKRIINH